MAVDLSMPVLVVDDYSTMIRIIRNILKQLGYETVDVLGYSLGGGVALRMAIQKPASVRRLVLVSTPYSEEGFYPGIRAQQTQISAAAVPMMFSR